MLYYVTIPSDDGMKGTVWETCCLAYTHNEYIFKAYLFHNIQSLIEFDVDIYEFEVSNTDELFDVVESQFGYELTVNYELELFQSVNNPECIYCATIETMDSLMLEDYTGQCVRDLWELLTSVNNIMPVIRFPPSIVKIIPLLLDKYCFLCALFSQCCTLDDIENKVLQEELKKLLQNSELHGYDDIMHFGLVDLIDDTLLLLKMVT